MKRLLLATLTVLAFLMAKADDVLQIVPVSVQAGITEDDEECFEFSMDNSEDVWGLQFELYLPEGISLIEDPFEHEFSRCPYTGKKTKTPLHIFDYNYVNDHYKVALSTTGEYYITGNEGVVFYAYFTTDENLAPGRYPIIMKDIRLIFENTKAVIPEAVSYVTVGEPSANEILDLGNGIVPSFVQSELPTQNVVVNGICGNLVISDAEPFSATSAFTAANVSYEREITNEWGTICLPYAINSTNEVQLYKPSSVDGSNITFTAIESLEAGEPAVFKKIGSDTKIDMSASNVEIVPMVKEEDSVDNMKLVGSLTGETIAEDGVHSYYYVAKNKVWPKNPSKDLTVLPQRAYFVAQNPASAKEFNICADGEESTAIRAFGEIMDGTAEYYDAKGRRILDMQKGVNIVRTADGNVTKVVIK